MIEKFAENVAAVLHHYVQVQSSADIVNKRDTPLVPLHTRLQRLLDTIPYNTQRQGLSLLELQACLRGRKGGLPHIGEMGAAMRKLGWQRHRAWSDENTAFSSRWYPPERC